MTSNRRMAILIAATIFLAAPATAPAQAQAFSADQRHEIESIVKGYLLEHPEVLQDIMAELDKRQQAAEVEKHRAAVAEYNATLFRSPHQVVLGNPQGNVTMVEFFDYNCGFCKRAMSDMLDLLKTNPISNSSSRNSRSSARDRSRPRTWRWQHACRTSPARSTSSFTRSCWAAAARPTRCTRSRSPKRSGSTWLVSRRTWAATR